ncbi:MAG: Phosphoserine transaminase [Lichina confinis]|nr:MAG: Phosphoserine transaminase [Lichina confinis]
MPSRSEVTYFSPGPAALPTEVLEAAAQALVNYKSTGIGLAEHSHRSALANDILHVTKTRFRTLLDIPDDYEVLFMQGGGSGEFSAVVYNLVGVWVERRRRRLEREITTKHPEAAKDDVDMKVFEQLQGLVRSELQVDYLVTGSWSLKASQEAARLIGSEHVNVAVDARKAGDGKFIDIPDEETWQLTPTKKDGGTGAAYVYYCDNETVDGVEFPSSPKCLEQKKGGGDAGDEEDDERIVVADMSSNMLSRQVDVRNYAVIFVSLPGEVEGSHRTWNTSNISGKAAAQKNVGCTGLTLVIVRKSLLPPATAAPPADLMRRLGLPVAPVILDYGVIAKNNSLYNTLSIFDVWVAGEVMGLLLANHGDSKVSGAEEVATGKAKLLYEALEKHPDVYQIVPRKRVRSRMNLCFRVAHGDPDVEKQWLAGAEKRGLLGLKGHRSVGGIRISNYNPIPLEGAQKLALYIEDFVSKEHDATAL